MVLSTVVVSAQTQHSEPQKTHEEVKNDVKTTEAVVKAVIVAEQKPEYGQTAKDAKKDREASAVVKATTEVLEKENETKENGAKKVLPEPVIERAADDAKKTFVELKDAGVSTKGAAAAAAEVETAAVDGASGNSLTEASKKSAEKAAVAAGKAVADHPDDQSAALSEAVNKVKKEEAIVGDKVLDTPSKGIVAKAAGAVSNLPKLAEGAVNGGVQTVETSNTFELIVMLCFIAGGVAIARHAYMEHSPSAYGKRIALIQQESRDEPGSADLESQYNRFDEFSEMKPY